MEFVESLSRRLWITKKTRMEASARLDNLDSQFEAVQILYTYILTALSIWVFYLEKCGVLGSESNASILLLLASVALTILSTYISSKGYKERAIKMRLNYNEIDKLHLKLSKAKDQFNRQVITEGELLETAYKVSEEYSAILGTIENHDTEDFLNALCDIKEEKMNRKQRLRYVLYKILHYGKFGVLYLGPIAIWYLYIK